VPLLVRRVALRNLTDQEKSVEKVVALYGRWMPCGGKCNACSVQRGPSAPTSKPRAAAVHAKC